MLDPAGISGGADASTSQVKTNCKAKVAITNLVIESEANDGNKAYLLFPPLSPI